jgi:glycolate oxidase FAD binding subunit
MIDEADITETLAARVREAAGAGTALRVLGGDSKAFYGRTPRGEPLEVAEHRGIVEYDPRELVVTARAGTPLAALEAALAEKGQMLPFEPPHFGPATLGGTLACNLSGPRRPFAGAARDLLLGARVLTGRGEVLSFGGKVMKNVAGYDVARLMAGAMGTLGVILEASLKVLPRPATELTLALEQDQAQAIGTMNRLAGRPLPLSAACWLAGRTLVRVSGTRAGVQAARGVIGGEVVENGEALWADLREQRLAFFAAEAPLWRLSLAATTPPLGLEGETLLDWCGAQRWLYSRAPADAIRQVAARHGGHATCFRGGDREAEVFHPLSGPLWTLHTRLKQVFDPQGILNPGRMYAAL